MTERINPNALEKVLKAVYNEPGFNDSKLISSKTFAKILTYWEF